MKILHTSDWHLGKRLPPFSREDEQREILQEIVELARSEKIDVTIVAGDVFDVSVPPASADELFYSAACELSRTCLTVAIAGNHDDGDRLKAPDLLAKVSGIILAGGFDCSSLSCSPFSGGEVEGRTGGIVYRKNGERLNLLLCPYLTESRKGDPAAPDFAEYVRGVLKERADDVFSADGCNMTVAHLFMLGSNSIGEERELGSAKLLPLSVLPECDYVALGHVHKPMKLKENVRYCGSILGYSFDAADIQRRVIIYDTVTKEIKEVPLKSGRKLVTARVSSFDEALEALKGAGDNFVKIVYDSPAPLTASKTSELERTGKLALLEIVPQGAKRETKRRAHRSARELFTEFYGTRFGGEKPSESLVCEFLELVGEENV